MVDLFEPSSGNNKYWSEETSPRISSQRICTSSNGEEEEEASLKEATHAQETRDYNN